MPAYAARQAFWTLDGDPMRWLGVGLFAAGGTLRIWPVCGLGRRFSGLVTIQPGHTLGWGLAFRAGVGVLLTALMIPPLLMGMRAEEPLPHTVWCRVRRLLSPDLTANSRSLPDPRPTLSRRERRNR